MRVLALDLSSHTGWAVDRPSGGDDPLFGEIELPGSVGIFGPMSLALYRHLEAAVQVHSPIGALAFEAPMPTGPEQKTTYQTVRQQFTLAANVELFAEMIGIPCYEETPQTVRKFFTGSGASDREAKARVALAAGRLGWRCKTTNEADACALWAFIKANTDPDFRFRLLKRLGR